MTTTSTSTRERRDWTLLIFIIPIGVILMLIAGQVAIRLVPIWSIDAEMQSKLDPNNLPQQQSGLVQPVLPAILTPLGWFDTFLTPGAGSSGDEVVFPPFVIFEPSATPVVTATPPPTVVTTVVTPTIPVTDTPTVVVTPPVTATKKPPADTPTPPTPTPPTPIATGFPSTPPVLYVPVIPPPPELGVNATPDGIVASIAPGTYTVIDLGVNGVVVSSAPDGNYDLAFYEALYGPGQVYMDQISIGISNSADGSSYYEVFNWGDNIPDTNTNVDTNTLPPDPGCILDAPECDNRVIPTSELYTPNASDPSIPQTGILIDVDTAPSAPPEGTYNYLVIISPPSLPILDPAQVDSVVVDEVPIPP